MHFFANLLCKCKLFWLEVKNQDRKTVLQPLRNNANKNMRLGTRVQMAEMHETSEVLIS